MLTKAERIANRQAFVCLEFSQKIHESSKRYPADRSLSQLFRQHKEFGSRDRRLIQQAVFAMFRWWGWIHYWEKSNWATAILLAYLLDENPWNSICEVWAKNSSSPQLSEGWVVASDLEKKQQWLSQYIQKDISSFPIKSLVPPFFIESFLIPEDSNKVPFERAFLHAFQHRPPLWIRLKTSKNKKLEEEFNHHHIALIPHKNLPQAAEIQGKINVHNLKQFKKGAFEIQDLASQCVGWLCSPNSGEHWWDVCAGGGGKSLHLAALMQGKGRVFSTEIREAKVKEIVRRADRGGWKNIQASHWDGEKVDEATQFDGVLIDVPCSGSGTWHRNPDARWRAKFSEIQEKSDLQLSILERVKNSVKRNGILVYATCSLIKNENEDIVNHFLNRNPNFKLDPIDHPITGEPTSGMVTFWPHWFNSDGMFVARMKSS